MSKTLTLVATGLVGLVLGAGIGAAAADGTDTPSAPERSESVRSMEHVHAAMTDDMPAELAAQCEQVHAAMAEHMGDADHTSMMASMGSTMADMVDESGAMPAGHDAHHPDTEE